MNEPPLPDVSDEAKAVRAEAEAVVAISKMQLEQARRLGARAKAQRERNHFGEAIAWTMRLGQQ